MIFPHFINRRESKKWLTTPTWLTYYILSNLIYKNLLIYMSIYMQINLLINRSKNSILANKLAN